jgi:hypothetical protein
VDTIIARLKDNFGQPHIIIAALLSEVKTLHPFKECDFHSIIKLSNSVNNLVATMEAMEYQAELKSSLHVEEFTRKLPPNKRLEWGKHVVRSKNRSLKDFASWLHKAKPLTSASINLYPNTNRLDPPKSLILPRREERM